MAKGLILLERAGSGKTYKITHTLPKLKGKRALYLTYTNENVQNLKKSLLEGNLVSKYDVMTIHSFLYRECILPFKSSIERNFSLKNHIKGINVNNDCEQYTRRQQSEFFQDCYGRLYSIKLTNLLLDTRFNLLTQIINRLNKYYDFIVVDEFQDITGKDNDFFVKLNQLCYDLQLSFVFCGDVYQSLVSTTQKSAPKKYEHIDSEEVFIRDKLNYKKRYADITTSIESRRITQDVATFIQQRMNINISSISENNGKVIWKDNRNDAIEALENCQKILVYKRSNYNIYSQYSDKIMTWKLSKGLTFDNIAIFLTDKTEKFLKSGTDTLATSIKNSLYVALTRAKHNVYLIGKSTIDKIKDL